MIIYGAHDITELDNPDLNHPNNPFSGINKFLSIYRDNRK